MPLPQRFAWVRCARRDRRVSIVVTKRQTRKAMLNSTDRSPRKPVSTRISTAASAELEAVAVAETRPISAVARRVLEQWADWNRQQTGVSA
jgi:hypothetical protein